MWRIFRDVVNRTKVIISYRGFFFHVPNVNLYDLNSNKCPQITKMFNTDLDWFGVSIFCQLNPCMVICEVFSVWYICWRSVNSLRSPSSIVISFIVNYRTTACYKSPARGRDRQNTRGPECSAGPEKQLQVISWRCFCWLRKAEGPCWPNFF